MPHGLGNLNKYLYLLVFVEIDKLIKIVLHYITAGILCLWSNHDTYVYKLWLHMYNNNYVCLFAFEFFMLLYYVCANTMYTMKSQINDSDSDS